MPPPPPSPPSGARAPEEQRFHQGHRSRYRSPLVLTVLLLLVLVRDARGMVQRFAIEPVDQTAVVGSHAVLPCRVVDKRGTLQWTKDGFALGADRNLSAYPRYTMIGSDDEGDFSLDITPVTLEDDAQFQCQVTAGPGGAGPIRSKDANLVVLVPPAAPRIVQGPYLVTTEDREIELECISWGGKPAAEITWIDGQGNVLTEGIETITEPLPEPESKRVTAKSILKLTPKKEHHGLNITCQAQNQADRTYKSASLRLEVKYAPKVSVSLIYPTGRRVHEFDEVRLACDADANPSDDLMYKWFVNDEPVSREFTTELVLTNVTRSLHDAIVKCEVHNAVGKSEESETLDISYGPKFRVRPLSVQAEQGSRVMLACDVDGNPPADIKWRHEDTSKTVGHSANLSLTVSAETAGRYRCTATVPGFTEVYEEAQVYMKGPPAIISHRTQFASVGDTAKVECVVFSVPRPQRVVWSRAGRELHASSDSDFSVREDPLPEGLKSTLIMRESRPQHYGAYNCSASNPFGTDVVEIYLKQSEGFKNIQLIFYSTIASLILVITFCIVCFCKCKRAPKLPEVDLEPAEKHQSGKHSDRSSNDSDLKVEIRTASSLSNMHEPGDSEPGAWEERSDAATPRLPLTNGGEGLYRYSADYTDPTFPPKSDGQNNNGYVAFVDYSRDYNPNPLQQQEMQQARNSLVYGTHHLPAAVSQATTILSSNSIDPRYSATYGNPYLRNSNNSLPHPHPSPSPVSSSPGGPHKPLPGVVTSPPNQPPPPAYGSTTRNGAVPQVSRLPSSPTSQFIVPNSQASAIKRGTLATHV